MEEEKWLGSNGREWDGLWLKRNRKKIGKYSRFLVSMKRSQRLCHSRCKNEF